MRVHDPHLDSTTEVGMEDITTSSGIGDALNYYVYLQAHGGRADLSGTRQGASGHRSLSICRLGPLMYSVNEDAALVT